MAIETVEFDLSMTDVDTGAYLTARTYNITVTDADGITKTTLSNLSIAQLVMAVCLERAVAKEREIIDTMNSLNATSSQLQAFTEIETEIVTKDGKKGESVNLNTSTVVYNGETMTYAYFLTEMFRADGMEDDAITRIVTATANADSADLINAIEQSMDKRNSLNQQTMIELQSATSKRDQAYDMITNISKSLNQVSIGIVNNI